MNFVKKYAQYAAGIAGRLTIRMLGFALIGMGVGGLTGRFSGIDHLLNNALLLTTFFLGVIAVSLLIAFTIQLILVFRMARKHGLTLSEVFDVAIHYKRVSLFYSGDSAVVRDQLAYAKYLHEDALSASLSAHPEEEYQRR